ncbi:hypothetical protein AC578_2790 [Pseudocercospora eumusae]|uniref:Asl1-like glycosyl hydrolase catalytic domain-containing protein n=1 Tax=Pseudocercospora eumusae TaxID=321146 RepID=A0A139HHA0_9PEZI|nr:hypothetical protein AC578_2790 [Pseudocercospora eumusae]KXT01763.1 hypothetical protein AC578_2790 [Pseudocercospora eumusae]
MRKAALLLAALPFVLCQTTSPKRGLALVESSARHEDDHQYWTSGDLTWYYNWHSTPSSEIDHTKLQYVPMMWGANSSDTSFYTEVKNLKDNGYNITWVLGFNEPDGCVNGGSCIDAETAAEVWIQQIEPLKDLGIQLGAPAVTGAPNGFVWLQNWFTACAGKCTPDFIPVHWYGNFEGLASHVGQVNATYENMTMWITEYAYAKADLEESQDFYNQSSAFFDRIDHITHYSYFGAFRSDVSKVGKNAAMLTEKGELTDIGAWYLGQKATGNVPKGDSTRAASFAGSASLVLAAALWCLG